MSRCCPGTSHLLLAALPHSTHLYPITHDQGTPAVHYIVNLWVCDCLYKLGIFYMLQCLACLCACAPVSCASHAVLLHDHVSHIGAQANMSILDFELVTFAVQDYALLCSNLQSDAATVLLCSAVPCTASQLSARLSATVVKRAAIFSAATIAAAASAVLLLLKSCMSLRTCMQSGLHIVHYTIALYQSVITSQFRI